MKRWMARIIFLFLPLLSHASEYLIKLRPHLSINKSLGDIKKITQTSFGRFAVISSPEKENEEAWQKKVASDPAVIYIEPNSSISVPEKNFKAEAIYLPANDYSTLQWGLTNTGTNEPLKDGTLSGTVGISGADIKAIDAWRSYTGDKKIIVAVIDTGIDWSHPDLAHNMWINEKEKNGEAGVDDDGNGLIDDIHGYDFANNDTEPMDDNEHGTHCAGIIGAVHDHNGINGVAQEVSLMPIKVLDAEGSGDLMQAIQGIDYAIKMGAHIMSNSWGGGLPSQGMREAIQAASNKNIFFIAAAGNKGANNDGSGIYFPSNYDIPNIIAVAATTIQDKLATFTNFGKKKVHIAAPGNRIISTVPKGQYAVFSGTSMATPVVSGAIALYLAHHPNSTMSEIKKHLMLSSTPNPSYRGTIAAKGSLNLDNFLRGVVPDRTNPEAPSEANWKVFPLKRIIESQHPYPQDTKENYEIRVPGAKFIKVKLTKVDLQSWDAITFKDSNKLVSDIISGTKGTDLVTDYIIGEQVLIDFDGAGRLFNDKYGLQIKEVLFQ